MALMHKTLIGGLNIGRNGDASVLLLMIVADGATEFTPDNHRVLIRKGENLAARAAQINAALTAMGRATLPAKEASVIGQTLTACWAAMDAP